MSFDQFLQGVDVGGLDLGASKVLVGAAIRFGLENGLSGAEMLRGLRGAGVGIREQDFYTLARTLRAEQAAGRLGESTLSSEIPDTGGIPQVPIGRPGTFVTNVTVTFRNAVEGGGSEIEQRTISVTSRAPISPANAASIVQEIWAEHNANYPALTLLDMAYQGTVEHVGAA